MTHTKKLVISPDLSLPLDAATRVAILAVSGAGEVQAGRTMFPDGLV